ncbi:MAG: hypothetical protein SGJ23_12810 [Alphaproteobacteria bacterium]|nr:hypothetical protein [Alphaproteobacteria bacterium]
MIDRAVFFDAIRFWETGRLGYNGVLAAVLLIVASLGDAWEAIARAFGLIIGLGVIANVLYCFAYPIDLIAQATPARALWRRWRWIAWCVGTGFAALLAFAATFGVGAPF